MSDIIISDAKVYQPAEKSVNTDRIGRTQFQPLSRDWVEFDPENFGYSSPVLIEVNNLKPSEFFQKGDRARIKQTTYRWFYIVEVNDLTDSSGTVKFAAGKDYVVDDAPITELATSRIQLPEGFPFFFNFDLVISATDSVSVDGTADIDPKFYINGKVCTIIASLGQFDIDGTPFAILLDLPVSPTPPSGLSNAQLVEIRNDFVYMVGKAYIYDTAPDKLAIIPISADFWDSTIDGAAFDITFSYSI